MMKQYLSVLFALLLGLPSAAVMADDKEEAAADAEKAAPEFMEQMPLLRSFMPSAVIVSYYFKLDSKGREPRTFGINVKACLEEQRPFQTFGFVISVDQVLTGNTLVLPDNLEKITVEQNGTVVEADLEAFYPERSAVRLKLKTPLAGMQALVFDGDSKKIGYNFGLVRENGLWVCSLRKFSPSNLAYNLDNDEKTVAMPHSLFLDESGRPVSIGYTVDGKMPLGDAWLDPNQWKSIPADALYREIAGMETKMDEGLYPVKIRMRRRQLQPNTREYFEEQRKPAELIVPGILMQDGRVMLSLLMTAQEIARIERITVTAKRKSIPAVFEATFKDFSIIMIRPEEKLSGKGIMMTAAELPFLTRQMLFGVEVRVEGDNLDLRTTPSFIRGFQDGWKNMLQPNMIPSGTAQLIFDREGKLIALPVRMGGARSTGAQPPPRLIPYSELVALLANPDDAFDRQSVPHPETDKDRLAWLGIEFQRMTMPLAELKEVMTYTENGNIGLLVTYIYPDSPAARIGLQVYDIVTRITPLATGVPIHLRGQEYDQNVRQNFPWNELDRVPEQYYERMPSPWQQVNNRLNNVLTTVGFGEKYRLNYIHDGKLEEKVLTVEAAPTHLGNAEKYQDKDLGLTVNDLTFEVRHYFRMENDASGVIITNIKTGSKASVAGLKPYEIIYSVNDVAVKDVAEFKAQVSGKTDFSFGVKRLNSTRIVKIQSGPEK